MASIIKVDQLSEKTQGSGITLSHSLKNSSGSEIISPSGTVSNLSKLSLTPSSAPSSPTQGDVYLDSSDNNLKIYTGGFWKDIVNASPGFSVEYLVVAGGGAGGGGRNYSAGGGGGGGGYKTATLSNSISGGPDGLTLTPLTLLTGTNYSITIGLGGSGNSNTNGTRGGTSTFATISTTGGGGGLAGDNNGTDERNGGSGGGVGRTDYSNPGTGISDEGYSGGQGQEYTGSYTTQHAGGGGGGASVSGSNGSGTTGGNGGSGKTSSIYGTSVSGGGGGGGASGGTGADGGTNGVNGNASNANANRGGGGGGGCQQSGTDGRSGGNGGSGIVVIRIPDTRSATFSAGVTSSLNTTGGYKTYTVTAAGPSDTVQFS